MTDTLDELFAELRAETLRTVQPAGTEPLRRAARRRRAALSSGAAVAVLAIAGLTAVVRPSGDTTPAAENAPSFSAATLTAEVARALEINDLNNPYPGAIITDTGFGSQQSRRDLLGGRYEVRMVCYGTGTMHVSVTASAVGAVPSTTVTPVVCDTAQTTVLSVPLTMPEPSGHLIVQVDPEVAGPGRAAFGYTLELALDDRSRWQQTAADVLGEKTAGYVSSGSQFLTDGGVGYEDERMEPGRYRVRAVCVGFGTVRLSAGPTPSAANPPTGGQLGVLRCAPNNPVPATVTYTVTGDGLYYDVEPAPEARGRAAVATMAERL
ncbi:hypothetical protein AB0M02_07420 [Actinoplanes sp. NPDC051861]|uniref:hypothetical protein n=1 Tax=Actinoplanes sp. NPDC051861 TaxID=3155170 RepID=UPI00341C4174